MITWSRFAEMKFRTVQPGQISSYDYIWALIFNPARRDRFPLGICLKKPIDSHWFKMFTKWWNFIKTFVYFFLTDWHHMRRKNTIEITTIYWNVLLWFSQTDVLIQFFIPLRQAEAITRENFIPAKQDPSCTKEGSRLAGMKRFTCNHRM